LKVQEKKPEGKDNKTKTTQFVSDEMVEVNGVKRWPEVVDEC